MLTCKAIPIIGMLLGQMTCEQVGAPPDTFCQIAKPFLWARTDTRLTKEQADTHNRIGKKLCGWK